MSNTSHGFVFGYVNPDTDGVCSAIGYSYLAKLAWQRDFEPVIFGAVNAESALVLNRFKIALPRQVSTLPSEALIVLVDTHHPSQLPSSLQYSSVVEILDHHPAGSPDLFPNAAIHNEQVGAVATLIAERFQQMTVLVPQNLAGALAAAIVSNTLDFSAPSTNQRDHDAFQFLNGPELISKQLITEMFQARSDIHDRPTIEVLNSDLKVFSVNGTKIGIAQIELLDAAPFIKRKDLIESMEQLRERHGLAHVIVNAVSIVQRTSTLIATDDEMRAFLIQKLSVQFEGEIAESPRILLRKTDLIPAFEEFRAP